MVETVKKDPEVGGMRIQMVEDIIRMEEELARVTEEKEKISERLARVTQEKERETEEIKRLRELLKQNNIRDDEAENDPNHGTPREAGEVD